MPQSRGEYECLESGGGQGPPQTSHQAIAFLKFSPATSQFTVPHQSRT